MRGSLDARQVESSAAVAIGSMADVRSLPPPALYVTASREDGRPVGRRGMACASHPESIPEGGLYALSNTNRCSLCAAAPTDHRRRSEERRVGKECSF